MIIINRRIIRCECKETARYSELYSNNIEKYYCNGGDLLFILKKKIYDILYLYKGNFSLVVDKYVLSSFSGDILLGNSLDDDSLNGTSLPYYKIYHIPESFFSYFNSNDEVFKILTNNVLLLSKLKLVL